jgi:hypothetical protein
LSPARGVIGWLSKPSSVARPVPHDWIEVRPSNIERRSI